MTKLREPLSIHAAVFTVCDYIGWDVAADVCAISESQLRKYTDPATSRDISGKNIIRLDSAFIKAGGDHAPISSAIQAQISLQSGVPEIIDEHIIEIAGELSLEVGEAIDAVLKSDRNHRAKKNAHRELSEVLEVVLKAIKKIGR